MQGRVYPVLAVFPDIYGRKYNTEHVIIMVAKRGEI